MKGSQVFTVLVVGENPSEIMAQYSENLKVDKYIKYKYKDARKLRENAIKIFEELSKDPKKLGLSSFHVDFFNEKKVSLKSMSDFEYYTALCEGLEIDEDGNAWSTENPNGKYQTCKVGNFFSVPFILNNNTTSHSARKGEIAWDMLHMYDVNLYENTWDLVHGEKEAVTENEKIILQNMQGKESYFSRFKDKEHYIIHNCAYWNYAIVDENGWHDIDESNEDFEWISTFYERFIEPLNNDEKLTIYECTKGKED